MTWFKKRRGEGRKKEGREEKRRCRKKWEE
jgi:hypothetical protein